MKTEAFYLVKKGAAKTAFEKREHQLPALKENEVLIESEAFGLNYADVMARLGMYKDAPAMPSVIGYELVGKIVELGPNADAGLLGKRVVAFCRFGGYAKHVVTWDYAAVPIDEIPADEAMALCTQAVTAYYMASYLAPIRKNDKVLVHAAAGGVGTILIQLAKMQGAIVFAKISSEHKAEIVKSLGADHVINYTKSDYASQIQKILNGEKLDVSFNAVAGSTFKKDLSLLGAGGRLFLFGAAELGKPKWGIFSLLNFAKKMLLGTPIGLIMQSKNILGVNMLRIADEKPQVLQICLQNVVALYLEQKIIPQKGGTYPVDELWKAHEALESGKTTGKLSVRW